MKDNKMTKREKTISIIAGIFIIGLCAVIIFQYFTIVNTQKELSKYTDEQQTVSNDDRIVWVNPDTAVTVENNNETDLSVETTTRSGLTDYVINKNSKKIHSPDCESAKQTLDKNKETVSWSDEEYLKALDEGYSPCSICKAGR